MPHLATALGAKDDPAFHQAYWRSFERTFGEQNSRMVKTMLLSKVKHGDTGDSEIDRICLGLRITMGWLADAIERTALHDAGYDSSATPKATDTEHRSKKEGGSDDDTPGRSGDTEAGEPMPPGRKRVLPS